VHNITKYTIVLRTPSSVDCLLPPAVVLVTMRPNATILGVLVWQPWAQGAVVPTVMCDNRYKFKEKNEHYATVCQYKYDVS
jgi:hypothetical protein